MGEGLPPIGQMVLGLAVIAIGGLAALAYPMLQIRALREMRGVWLLLAAVPFLPMAYIIVITAMAFRQRSNLWPILLILTAPFGAAYFAILRWLHRWLARGAREGAAFMIAFIGTRPLVAGTHGPPGERTSGPLCGTDVLPAISSASWRSRPPPAFRPSRRRVPSSGCFRSACWSWCRAAPYPGCGCRNLLRCQFGRGDT